MPGPNKSIRTCKNTDTAPLVRYFSIQILRSQPRILLYLGSLFVYFFGMTSASADNLLDVAQKAKQNDPAYLAAEANYRAQQQLLPQARALLMPNLSANADYSRNSNKTTRNPGESTKDVLRDGSFNSKGYSLSLTQPVFNGASFAALKQAKTTVRKAIIDFAVAKQDLFIRTSTTYFEVLRAQDNLELAVAEKTSIARQLELANARLEVGLATITEVHEARARYQAAEAAEIESQNLLEDAREALQELTGTVIDRIDRLKSDARLKEEIASLTPDPPDIKQWVKTALAQNLKLQSSETEMEIAKQQIHLQRSGHLPTLDIVGNSSRTDSDGSSSLALPDDDLSTENNTIGLELSIPLFQGGLITAQSKEAKYLYTASVQEHERQRRATIRSTRAAFLGVNSGVKRIQALNQSVIAGESALDAKNQGFQAGINTNQDVLDAQRDLFRAKRDHADARYSYILNLLLLKQSAGTLDIEDLNEINGWLTHE